MSIWVEMRFSRLGRDFGWFGGREVASVVVERVSRGREGSEVAGEVVSSLVAVCACGS